MKVRQIAAGLKLSDPTRRLVMGRVGKGRGQDITHGGLREFLAGGPSVIRVFAPRPYPVADRLRMRLALFQPDIPQNLGASIRLTACLGVPLDVIEPCGFPLDDRAVRRAAMDYAMSAAVRRHPGWRDFVSARQGRLVLFTTRGATPFHDFEFRSDDILLFGRESAGVPDEVHEAADARLLIPLAAGARSLNVVTAAAIGLAEALRQTAGFPRCAPA